MTQKYQSPTGNLDLIPSDRVKQLARECKKRGVGWKFQDFQSFAYSYTLGTYCLLQSHPCRRQVLGEFKRILMNVLESGDLLGFIETCATLRSELVQTGIGESLLRLTTSRWGLSVVNAIGKAFDLREEVVHPSPVFDAVATWLGWLKRLPVCVRHSSDAVAAYKENEDRLSSVDFDECVYVPQLEEIWFEWLKSFKLREPFTPRHGSGSTADAGRVRAKKWQALGWDTAARVCMAYPDLQKVLDWPAQPMTRQAKVVFVPKQAGKDRTICMEPAWLQYLQQGVMQQLVEYIHDGGQLSWYINLFSQEQNRLLCATALEDGLATIDLSDASDCVSWRLIKRLAHRLPLLRYLYATRSNRTLLSSREYQFDKFAPMGSALCFPIECILFASIVELAYRIHNDEASRGFHSGCSVYGDDIICPSEIYDLVVDILQCLGFRVNESKSFSSGRYYESCGVEYLDGALITTIRHPRTHLLPSKRMSPVQVEVVTDLANTFLHNGFTDARRFLLKSYEEAFVSIGDTDVPFNDLLRFDTDHLIPIMEPYDRYTWNSDLQVSGVWRRVVETYHASSPYDLHEYWSHKVPRTRAERMTRGRRFPLASWSKEGLLFLSASRHWDLLEKGRVESVGASKAGRLHYRLRKSFFPRG